MMWGYLKIAISYLGIFFKKIFQSPVTMAGFGVMLVVTISLFFKLQIGELKNSLSDAQRQTQQLEELIRVHNFTNSLNSRLLNELDKDQNRLTDKLKRIEQGYEQQDLDQLTDKIEKQIREQYADEIKEQDDKQLFISYQTRIHLLDKLSVSSIERMWDFYDSIDSSADSNSTE